MAALSYKARFAEYVENGLQNRPGRVKRQTIRGFRKYPIKVGETLHHFYAMRTKQCKKLGISQSQSVQPVIVKKKTVTIFDGKQKQVLSSKPELDQLAYDDGFDDWDEMKRWWIKEHGESCFPFTGQLIKW